MTTKPKHGGARAGAGRKAPDGPKTAHKHIRVTPAQEQAQIAAAQAEGLSWSAWIIRAAERAAALESVARGEASSVPGHLWLAPPITVG